MRQTLLCSLLCAVVLATTAVASANESRGGVVSQRANLLLAEVNRNGLRLAVRNATETLDLSLLELIADAMGEHDTARELHRSVAAPPSPLLLEGSAIARGETHKGTPFELRRNLQDAPPNQITYRVQFENRGTDVLSEVVVFWRSPGVPVAGQLVETNIHPGEARLFQLGRCDLMTSYVIGVFVNGQRVLRLPPEGQEMTPSLASKVHPQDNEPCADSWTLHARPAQ
jgi:hypothetical protein